VGERLATGAVPVPERLTVDGLAGELSGEQREYLGIMLENASKIRSALDRTVSGPPGPS